MFFNLWSNIQAFRISFCKFFYFNKTDLQDFSFVMWSRDRSDTCGKKISKNLSLVVGFTPSVITFVTESNLSERIIWFYLVRAEVVLWWHCLIFFAQMAFSIRQKYHFERIPRFYRLVIGRV